MFRIRRSIRLGKPLNRSFNLPAKRWANPLSKQSLCQALHVMGPTLTALLVAGVGSGVAHACHWAPEIEGICYVCADGEEDQKDEV